MPTYTTTYSLGKPVVGADEDAWGDTLNTSLDAIDDILDGTTPVTGIDINSGTLDGVTIGGTTAGAGTFTTLTATSTATFAGLSTTADITFGDNDKAIFGAGSDLQIYHNNNQSFISESGSGSLFINASDLVLRNTSGEYFFYGNSDGSVILYHDNAPKLATTSTGIDVTGTVTADGADVSGGADSTGQVVLSQGNTTSKVSRIIGTNQGGTNERGIDFNTYYYADFKRMNISPTGDISFYEDTGTTAKFFWDASAESLGIGTSSPSAPLEVSASGASIVQITSGTNTSQSALYFADPDDTNAGYVLYDHTSNYMSFRTNGSGEDMRIDSSGNLLVGTTSGSVGSNNTDEYGINLFSTGVLANSVNNASALILNRQNGDGNIAVFRKDGTTVGSIGSASGATIYIDGGSQFAGLQFGGDGVSEGRITPRRNGASADAATDLGTSSLRFKDLYLSGGVYLGGTGAANKLDDYEEGSWTPTVKGETTAGTATYLGRWGNYTKIGNLVTVRFYLNVNSFNGTGVMRISGLPFTSGSDNGIAAGGINPVRVNGTISLTTNGVISLAIVEGSTEAIFFSTSVTTSANSSAIDCDGAWAGQFEGSYFV